MLHSFEGCSLNWKEHSCLERYRKEKQRKYGGTEKKVTGEREGS